MSTPDPNDTRYNSVDPDAPVVEPPPRSNALLWILLLLVLIALGWWWFGKQAEDIPAPLLPASTDQPIVDETANTAKTVKPTTTTPVTKKPVAKPKPVAGITRDPSPLTGNEAPRYPAQALRSGVEGSVSVRIEVDATGKPTDVQVVERSGERSRDLDRAVMETARKWRFNPAMKDGKAVAGAVVLPVEFKRE